MMKKKTRIIIVSVTSGIILLTASVVALLYIIISNWYAYPEYAYDKNDNFEEIISSYEFVKDFILEYEESGLSTRENSLYYFNSDHNIYEAFDDNETPLLPEGTEIRLYNENISHPYDINVFNGSVSFACDGDFTGCEIVYTKNIRKYLRDTNSEHFEYNKIAKNWYSVFA